MIIFKNPKKVFLSEPSPSFFPGHCFTRVLAGYRHFSSASRDALSVSDRDECALRCTKACFSFILSEAKRLFLSPFQSMFLYPSFIKILQASYCHTFSYHYFLSGGISDNCVLSPLESGDWDAAHDLVVDSNWDVYERASSDNLCSGRSNHGLFKTQSSSKPPRLKKIYHENYIDFVSMNIQTKDFIMFSYI